MRRLLVALLLELPGVLFNELLDVIRHREQPEPLLLIESHGVAPQSIDGHSPTLRDLEKRALPRPGAELLVLPLKSLELRMHVVWHTHLLPATPLTDESRPCEYVVSRVPHCSARGFGKRFSRWGAGGRRCCI